VALSRYYLDTNAWIDLLRSETGLAQVLDAWKANCFDIIFSQENRNELIDNENISDSIKQRDLPRLNDLIEALTADEVAILDHGKLGLMKLASVESSEAYSRHLASAATGDRNTIADGVHLINTMSHSATLVTSDGEVIKSAEREKLLCITLNQFLEIEGLTPLSNLGG
jgi:predicted nucleic acid-binding protein